MCDYKRVWDMDWTSPIVNCANNRNFDPRHKRVNDVYQTGVYRPAVSGAAHQGETLLCCGLMDTITPPSTQFAAYNKITAPKRYELWPDFGHEHLPESNDLIFSFMAKML